MNESPLNWPRNFNPTPQIEGRRPGNLLPQKFSEWPAGRNRASNDAEELLSSAVAWWDASAYRNGDRFLRNLGVGGECLNARLGSSTIANSNDPQYLAPEDSGYVYLPGAANNSMSVPDENALDLSTGLDIMVRVAADDWTPASPNRPFLNKAAANGGYQFYLFSDGTFYFLAGNGTTYFNARSSAANTLIDGSTAWVRCTFRSDNGSGLYEVAFYTAPDSPSEPASWTQLGTTRTGATQTIAANTSSLNIGTETINALAGRIYRAIVKDGIDGTTVLDIDCDSIESSSQTNFTARTGQIVQINRSTSGRKSVAMPSRKNGGQPIFLFGTDDYLEVQGNEQHQLLNFDTGDSFTVFCVYRRWSLSTSNSLTLISKGANPSFTVATGWGLYTQQTGDARSYNRDIYGNTVSNFSAVINFGGTIVGGMRKDATTSLPSIFSGTTLSTGSKVSLSSLATTLPVRIGAAPTGGLGYVEMELIAAAIFRRPLSQQEITTITNYYQNRTRFTYTIPSDNDQKTFMASRLGVSSSVAALDILKDAPFYIDSRNFTAGSQYVQNLGWRRDGLNIRLGSSQSSDSNDPLYLNPESSGYVYLPGVASNFLSVPDEAALDITGDIDIRAFVSLDDWTPSTFQPIVMKWDSGQLSYGIGVQASTGTMTFGISVNGTNQTSGLSLESSLAPSIVDGSPLWVRATYDADTGSGQYSVKFWTSSNGTSWNQLGLERTGVSVAATFSGTSQVTVGQITGTRMTGRVYRAIVKDGIDGTTVLDINCNSITSASASSFTAVTGQTVSINRSTSGRKSVSMPSTTNGGRPIFLLGTDDYFEIEGDVQHALLNFTNGDSFTVIASMRQWPTISNPISVITKKNTSIATTTPGYGIRANGVFSVADGKQNTSAIGSITNGIMMTTIGVRQGIISQYVYSNNSQSSLPIMSDFDSHVNTDSLRIGSVFAGTQYADMEFTAAAIFRRALSASEISTLTTFFTS